VGDGRLRRLADRGRRAARAGLGALAAMLEDETEAQEFVAFLKEGKS
jgi:hypothetical protein